MFDEIIDKEKKKYDALHKMSGYEETSSGYGRQLGLVMNSDSIFFKNIRNSIKRETSVLEIGIGAGEMTQWLINCTDHSVSIDISEYAVDSVKKISGAGEDRIKENSAHDLNFESCHFDVVLHLDGMEHIPHELEVLCLKEACRVLKSGGRLYYANACCDAWWDHIMVSQGYDNVHINVKTPAQWVDFYQRNVEEFGCSLEHHEVSGDTIYVIIGKN